MMNIYTNTVFEGHYPVGSAAIVVAKDAFQATDLLLKELAKHGLRDYDEKAKREILDGMRLIDVLRPKAPSLPHR